MVSKTTTHIRGNSKNKKTRERREQRGVEGRELSQARKRETERERERDRSKRGRDEKVILQAVVGRLGLEWPSPDL